MDVPVDRLAPGTPGAAALVADLVRDAWTGTVDPRSSGHRFTEAEAKALLDDGADVFVARVGAGDPLGCVVSVTEPDGVRALAKLAVRPGVRGGGVGAALVDAVLGASAQDGVAEVRLAVSAYEPELVQYYARFGFRVDAAARYAHASPSSPAPIVMSRPVGDRADAARSDPVGDAVRALAAGALVAVPTETVYGLGALASDPLAVRRVFAVKGRPIDHPLIVHVASARALDRWAVRIPDAARRLASALWPGPLTLVLERAPGVLDEVTGGRPTVALRVPRHPLLLAVLALLPDGAGIAAPSANRFGRVSPTTAGHVAADLGDLLASGDVVLDGGPASIGVESTIVDCTGAVPVVLRPGGCAVEEIELVLGVPVRRDPTGPARAPGMHAVHYAPLAGVRTVPWDAPERVALLAVEAAAQGRRVGVLAPAGIALGAATRVGPELAQADYTGARLAPDLYAHLRQADALALDLLVVLEPPDGDGLGWAVRDRLRRAAAAAR